MKTQTGMLRLPTCYTLYTSVSIAPIVTWCPHVMPAAQQAHHKELAVVQMDSTTAYIAFDFKQKFLAKGFRKGGDCYYGKKGMLWWGAGVYVMEIDFTAD